MNPEPKESLRIIVGQGVIFGILLIGLSLILLWLLGRGLYRETLFYLLFPINIGWLAMVGAGMALARRFIRHPRISTIAAVLFAGMAPLGGIIINIAIARRLFHGAGHQWPLLYLVSLFPIVAGASMIVGAKLFRALCHRGDKNPT